MKSGVDDIKNSKFFAPTNWMALYAQTVCVCQYSSSGGGGSGSGSGDGGSSSCSCWMSNTLSNILHVGIQNCQYLTSTGF